MKFTARIQTIMLGVFAGLANLFAWLTTVPPEQQSGILAQLVDITPLSWRPNVALLTKFLDWGLGVYALYKASQPRSGLPVTPVLQPPSNVITK